MISKAEASKDGFCSPKRIPREKDPAHGSRVHTFDAPIRQIPSLYARGVHRCSLRMGQAMRKMVCARRARVACEDEEQAGSARSRMETEVRGEGRRRLVDDTREFESCKQEIESEKDRAPQRGREHRREQKGNLPGPKNDPSTPFYPTHSSPGNSFIIRMRL